MAKIPEKKAGMTRAENIGRLAEEAADCLAKNAGRHQKILGDIIRTLERIVDGRGWTVHGRVKGSKSLQEKILRKGYYQKYEKGTAIIEDLPDLIGVRIQCLLNREEILAYDILQRQKEETDDRGYAVYQTKNGAKMALLLRNQPEKQKNGHDIYRIEGKYFLDPRKPVPVHFELQIKSMVHSFWGELEHSMFYKNYDHFISQKILAQSMDNILSELNLIDQEMDSLQNNFSRSDAACIEEMKSVFVTILQKEYQNKISAPYGGKMDLRAVYQLVVEIYFNYTTGEEAAKNLGDMIQRCREMNLEDAQKMIQEKLDMDRVSSDNRACVQWLDRLIKENVYWEAFFCIYVTLKQEPGFGYKKWIEDIAWHLQDLRILKQFRGDFPDYDFAETILSALILGANEKIEYFTDEKTLKQVQEKISNGLRGRAFAKYEQGCEQEDFDKKSVLESVFYWTKSLIDFLVRGHLKLENVIKLKNCMEKENIFPFDIEDDQIKESFDGTKQLSGQKAEELYRKWFAWETVERTGL